MVDSARSRQVVRSLEAIRIGNKTENLANRLTKERPKCLRVQVTRLIGSFLAGGVASRNLECPKPSQRQLGERDPTAALARPGDLGRIV